MDLTKNEQKLPYLRRVLFSIPPTRKVFWAVPVIKQWGRAWQVVGIAGTVVFAGLWFGTHTHSLFGPGQHMYQGALPSNGSHSTIQLGAGEGEHFARGKRPTGLGSIPQIEFFQVTFVVLYAGLGAMLSGKKIADRPASS